MKWINEIILPTTTDERIIGLNLVDYVRNLFTYKTAGNVQNNH